MSIELKQHCDYKGDDWWEWAVWVEGSKDELSKIKSVTYRLHETFPNPVRTKTNRAQKFRLESAGWGEFTIVADIDTGAKKLTKKHYLKLEYPKDEEREREAPAIYLCYAAYDKKIAIELEQALKSLGDNVITSASVTTSGWSYRAALVDSLRHLDAFVLVVSEEPSEGVLYETGLAQGAGVPVLIVKQAGARIPEPLAKVPAEEFEPSSQPLGGVAQNVHDRVQKMLKKAAAKR